MDGITEALGGPVLAWGVRRATHGYLGRGLQIAYCVWLTLQAWAWFGATEYITRAVNPPPGGFRREALGEQHVQQLQFVSNHVEILLQYQLVLVIAITPALTASSLGKEKERGTLFALFGTQLTSRQILIGMLLGRLLLLMPLLLTALPALVFMVTWTEREATTLLLAMLQQVVLVFSLGVVGLLFGIWLRSITEAVMASYLFLGLAYVILRVVANSVPGVSWLLPVEGLVDLLQGHSPLLFVAHLVVWALLGSLCLWQGCRRLREVCVEQLDKKPSRRIWAYRPPVGNDPIRWRECHVIGLAPLPIFRAIPRWVAVFGVFAGAVVLNGLIALDVSPAFVSSVSRFDFETALACVRTKARGHEEATALMGIIFVLLGCFALAVRCATSVPEEKRRNTWDDLLLTAQSFREITTGKMWGILQATVPYVIAYTLPMFFFAWMAGPGALLMAGFWIVVPCAVVGIAVYSGIDMVQVPRDMDETRADGAFWFERQQARRRTAGRPVCEEPDSSAIVARKDYWQRTARCDEGYEED